MTTLLVRSVLACCGTLLTIVPATSALADRKIDLAVEPPPPVEQRSMHVHDGFYLRASLGVGSLGIEFDEDDSERDLEGSGFAMGLDLLVGGSPSRGLALGGALLTTGAVSMDFERAGRVITERNVALAVLGPFVDGYPDPKGGWHLGLAVGLAGVDIENDQSVSGVTKTQGVGGAGWVGHDFWIGEEWSAGLLFRLSGALTGDEPEGNSISSSAIGGMLMMTAVYH